MKRRKGFYQQLSSILTVTLVATSLSAVSSTAALADAAGYVNSGPGVTGAQQAGTAEENILPADSPNKAVPIAINLDNWIDLGNWNTQDIRGISFEVGCKTDWDGGGGGGIYIDNWDQTPQFSFTTTKERIIYMFQETELARLKQNVKLNLWWTWSDAEGKTHLDDIYFKPESVRLIVDKNAQPITQPGIVTGAVSSGGGGGGGSSSGGGSGSSGNITVSDNSDYKYIVRDKSKAIPSFDLFELCPDYQLGDIVRITMKTKGGDEWNSYDLVCYQDDQEVKVSKKGGVAGNTLVLEAKPDGGTFDLVMNWLGGDYMLYAFQIDIIGHGDPVDDETLAEFDRADFEAAETEANKYVLDLTEALKKAMSEASDVAYGDSVVIRAKVDISGGCYTWSSLKLVTGESVRQSDSIKPQGSIRETIEFSGVVAEDTKLQWEFNASAESPLAVGTVAKLKELVIEKAPDTFPLVITQDLLEEEKDYGNGEYQKYAISLADFYPADAVYGTDEVKITITMESNGKTWEGKFGVSTVSGEGTGWATTDSLNQNSTETSLTCIPYAAWDNFRLLVKKGYDADFELRITDISIEKVIPEEDNSLLTFTSADADQAEKEEAGDGSYNYLFDLSELLKERIPDDAEPGVDTVDITMQIDEYSTYGWNELRLVTTTGTAKSEIMKPNGGSPNSFTVKVSGIPTEDPELKLAFLSVSKVTNIGTVKIMDMQVTKGEASVTPVDPPVDPEPTDPDVLCMISYADYEAAGYESSNTYKKYDVTEYFNAALEAASDQEIATGDDITITAEFDSQGINWWQFCGSAIKETSDAWGSTAAKNGTQIIWSGPYGDMSWIDLQMGEMEAEGYLTLKSLTIVKTEQSEPIEPDDGVLLTITAEDMADWTTETNSVNLSEYFSDSWPEDAELGTDEVTITAVVTTENIWTWSKLGLSTTDGWKDAPSGSIQNPGTYTITITCVPTTAGNLQWQFYGKPGSEDAKATLDSLEITKTESQAEPAVMSLLFDDLILDEDLIIDEDLIASGSDWIYEEEELEEDSETDSVDDDETVNVEVEVANPNADAVTKEDPETGATAEGKEGSETEEAAKEKENPDAGADVEDKEDFKIEEDAKMKENPDAGTDVEVEKNSEEESATEEQPDRDKTSEKGADAGAEADTGKKSDSALNEDVEKEEDEEAASDKQEDTGKPDAMKPDDTGDSKQEEEEL